MGKNTGQPGSSTKAIKVLPEKIEGSLLGAMYCKLRGIFYKFCTQTGFKV